MKRPSEVRLDRVAFTYGAGRFAFDAAFPAGEISAVMGPSGSGKTTLLHLVAGFELPATGRILIGDADVTAEPPERRPVSMVFQENNLFGHIDIAGNVGLGIRSDLRLAEEERARANHALRRVGLADKDGRLPRELSGGERSRAALARALLRDRPVLLLDEPFAALGPSLRQEMAELIAELSRENAMTVLFVTHQPEDAERLASRVVFLEAGTVAAQGHAGDFFGESGPEAFLRYIGDAARGRG